MSTYPYPISQGVHPIPAGQVDLRPDAEIDASILSPPPITTSKNVFFFWHSGFPTMHAYTKRNARAWYRRFSPLGWFIYVLDRVASSPLNIVNYFDISDPETFPRAFRNGTIGGDYAPQHTSDLVRWPLLLRYGGVYADVGLTQVGDLDRVWNETIGDPASRFAVLSYNSGGVSDRSLTNYFLAANKENPLFARCQKLLLALWAEDGGKTDTEGMHAGKLVKGIPMMMEGSSFSIDDEGGKFGPKEVSSLLTDYIIQGQFMTMVMGLVDEEDGWDGPRYVNERVFAVDMMEGSQLVNEYTAWGGRKAFELMSLRFQRKGRRRVRGRSRRGRLWRDACRGALGLGWRMG